MSKLAALILLLGTVGGAALPQTGIEQLTAEYRRRPSARTRQPLERYAAAHRNSLDGALALLVLGSGEAAGERAAESIPRLREAQRRLPQIRDYVDYYLALALYHNEESLDALPALEEVLNHDPPSPLANRAALLAAEIYLGDNAAPQAVSLLREYMPILPQPEGLLLLAKCLESAGQPAAAVPAYQRIYYDYPITAESRAANAALTRLRRRLGSNYPPASSAAMFDRVEKLIKARQHLTARKELQQMTVALGGADRDRARVWLGKARHIRRHDDVAYRWLKSLRVSDPAVEAERLYYLLESARRLHRRSEVLKIAAELEAKHPTSEWRLKGLVSAGNMYLLVNDHVRYLPLYRACASAFPSHPRAAYCDWKIVWSHYIRRRPEAAQLLRHHLTAYPSSDKATAALYYLARLAEAASDWPAAKTWYLEIAHQYPNYYYATLARKKLHVPAIDGATESPEVRAFLDSITFPRRRHTKDFEPTAITKTRLERGRLLFRAGLHRWGESELRFAARTDAQGPVLAMELSEAAYRQRDYGRSIRYIKGLAPGYLSVPLGDAPLEFWRLAFPLPYRESLEKYCSRRQIDLYFLAALIRQESEFDTRAVSRSRAYGLTQVLPATGRHLSRRLGIRGFKTSMLYRPDVNVNMGTYYLRGLIDDLGSYTEAALAAYNAGRSRARAWLTWADYREPSEFIETIPFSETRHYIQMVLRNADVYARIYGQSAR